MRLSMAAEEFRYTCRYRPYGSDSYESFATYFCPSEPDKCEGCELDDYRRRCPDCGAEWDTRDTDFNEL